MNKCKMALTELNRLIDDWNSDMKTLKDKNYSREHTKQRLKERYDIAIIDKEYDALCYMLSTYKGAIVSTDNNGVQRVYDIVLKGQKIRVVWDSMAKCIKTVM